jgi:hypothetical protein
MKIKPTIRAISRRQFIRGTAVGTLGLTVLPRHVLGLGAPSPNEKLNIAAIGCACKGGDDINGVASENIVALCDVDWRHAAGTFKKFPNAKRYKDYRRMLDELGIPHLIFVNRIDQSHGRIRDLLSALQPTSVSPLIARQIPIRDGEKVTGFVDLALERAYHYVPGKESQRIEIPEDLQQRETEARTQMLEHLADHDDELLEQLLMDQAPAQDRVIADLARETGDSLGVPVAVEVSQPGDCTELADATTFTRAPLLIAGVTPSLLAEALSVMRSDTKFYIETTHLLAPDTFELVRDSVPSGAERLVFASYAPLRYLSVALAPVLTSTLSDAHKTAVLGGNLKRLLTK